MSQKPLKVAWISDFPIEWLPNAPERARALPKRHPATWQMVLLSEFQRRTDLEVNVIVLRHRIAEGFSFQEGPTTFHVLKAPPWARLASVFWLDTMLIRKACQKIQPDLIHAWGNEKGAGLIAHRLGHPWLMTVQGLFGWYKQQVPLNKYDRFSERLERTALLKAPLVTTESKFAVEFLRKHYPQLTVHQAEHAPNRVFFEVSRQPETKPVHFLCPGTLGYRKGTDLLFAALNKLSPALPFRCTFVTNPSPAYLEEMKATLSPAVADRLSFKYHIPPAEVAAQLQSPTMMLLPTRADVSPNAAKECVVAGVPVIAAKVGGIPDYVADGKNGILFAPGDEGAFMKAIREGVNHPLFGKGGVDAETLRTARDYLSPSRMAENFLAAYRVALRR